MIRIVGSWVLSQIINFVVINVSTNKFTIFFIVNYIFSDLVKFARILPVVPLNLNQNGRNLNQEKRSEKALVLSQASSKYGNLRVLLVQRTTLVRPMNVPEV